MRKRADKREFAEYVCRPYCSFFREGKKEEMACEAAAVVVKIMRLKGLPPHPIGALSGRRYAPGGDDPPLLESVCRSCPFVTDGCDFRAPSPPPDAVPCGGLILLGLLLKEGLITYEEIEAALDG